MTPKKQSWAPVDLAANLKEAREKAGMTQAALAELAEVGKRSLQEYENNEASPRVDALVKIAKALGLPTAELLR